MKKRTWFITGISSGFGYELTKQLLEKGAMVIGIFRMDSVLPGFNPLNQQDIVNIFRMCV